MVKYLYRRARPCYMIAKQLIDSAVEPENSTSTQKTSHSGDKSFWLDNDGELHREDGPAVEHANGTKAWYKKGRLHRLGGPALVYDNGDERWYKDGLLHREDGPAMSDVDGLKEWHLNGRRHRIDGPAIMLSGGLQEYYVNGRKFSEEEFYKYVDPITGEIFLPPGRKLNYDS